MLGSGSLVVAEGASLTGVTASSGFLTNAGFTINVTQIKDHRDALF